LSEASGVGLWELVVAFVFCSWCGGRWRWHGCGGSGKIPADVPSSSSIPAARCFLRFFKAALLRTGPVWLWLGGALVAFVFAGFQVVPLFVDNRLCGGSSFCFLCFSACACGVIFFSCEHVLLFPKKNVHHRVYNFFLWENFSSDELFQHPSVWRLVVRKLGARSIQQDCLLLRAS
jgi:hypothetical protein